MIKRKDINIEINGKVSEHVLYSSEKSTSLVVVIPGGNNNSLTPFLYYLRDYFIHKNYDLLRISYNNLAEREDSDEEKMNTIAFAVHKAIVNNEESKTYNNYLFVSRSIGNVVANKIKTDYKVNVSKSIYISPISEALEDIQKYPGLIISATNDEYFKKEDIEELLTSPNQEVLIFENGNHHLECDDTLETIDFCKNAVSKVIEFVNKK